MNGKKFLVIGLLSLFMISMFAGFVVAEDEILPGGQSIIDLFLEKIGFSGSVGGVATFFGESNENKAEFSRILLILLVILFVYAIVGNLPFLKGPDKGFVRWGVSIIVGVLSFMLISTQDILLILTNYEALGIALTSIIPLAIMVGFFLELKKEHSAWGTAVSRPAFIIFFIFSVWRWLTYRGESNLAVIYGATAFITLVWIVIEKRMWERFKKVKKEEGKKKFEETLETAATVDKAKVKQFKSITEGQGEEFD